MVRDEKDDRLLSHQVRRPRLTKGEKIFFKKNIRQQRWKVCGQKERNSVPKQNVITRHVAYGILPCVKNNKSQTGCKFGSKCFFRHVDAEEKPSKKSKKGGAKGSVALFEGVYTTGLYLKILYPRSLFYVRRENCDQTRRQILQGHLAQMKNSCKKGVHREEFSKSVNLMSGVPARPS